MIPLATLYPKKAATPILYQQLAYHQPAAVSTQPGEDHERKTICADATP